MADSCLPIEKRDRGLRYLFLDLNSYFASVEQQERPELRGKPIAVVPMMADTTVALAASYEAKRFGVKTGTTVRDARVMCPNIVFVDARPKVYVAYHHRVLDAVSNVLPIDEVCSIDEMRFRLLGEERQPARARELALEMKQRIATEVGDYMRCSIGIAPNAFLAKIGTELQKPDGLVTIQSDDLPTRLHDLKLRDFTGINYRMEIRLNAAGIFTAEQLCAATRHDLHRAFGSITGARWWYLLRGFDVVSPKSERKTLGHSHILPPNARTDAGCRETLLRLMQKASARLRSENLYAAGMTIYVRGMKRSWDARVRLPASEDSVLLNELLLKAWKTHDFESPIGVGITFYDLHPLEEVTPSLFDPANERGEFNAAIDEMNQRFGKNKVFLAAMAGARDRADEKIAFNKTWLFSEGKGDNEWVDTFRGPERVGPTVPQ